MQSNTSRYVAARIQGERLVFAIADVREVLGLRAMTPLFHTDAAVLGVVYVRGDIVPVLDLGNLLLGSTSQFSGPKSGRLVVLRGLLEPDSGKPLNAGKPQQVAVAVCVDSVEPLRADGELTDLPKGRAVRLGLARRILVGTHTSALLIDIPALLDVPSLQKLRA